MAPYDGLGSIEDSMQSCLSLVPQPPKKDFIKMLENDHAVLRFEATMVSEWLPPYSVAKKVSGLDMKDIPRSYLVFEFGTFSSSGR